MRMRVILRHYLYASRDLVTANRVQGNVNHAKFAWHWFGAFSSGGAKVILYYLNSRVRNDILSIGHCYNKFWIGNLRTYINLEIGICIGTRFVFLDSANQIRICITPSFPNMCIGNIFSQSQSMRTLMFASVLCHQSDIVCFASKSDRELNLNLRWRSTDGIAVRS